MTSCVYRDAGVLQRTVRWTAATRPLAWLYARIQQPLDTLVYRLSRRRTTLSSWMAGVQLVMLTTTGARSGRRRTVPVLAIRDGEAFVVIASNFGRRAIRPGTTTCAPIRGHGPRSRAGAARTGRASCRATSATAASGSAPRSTRASTTTCAGPGGASPSCGSSRDRLAARGRRGRGVRALPRARLLRAVRRRLVELAAPRPATGRSTSPAGPGSSRAGSPRGWPSVAGVDSTRA